jgi:hypothetical protein
MRADVSLWDELTKLDQIANSFIEKARRFVEPTEPISREIPFFASIEVRFDSLPALLTAAPVLASNALSGANKKRGVYSNNGSRVYVNSLAFSQYFVTPNSNLSLTDNRSGNYDNGGVGGLGAGIGGIPPNWRWNFETSITQRRYSDRSVGRGAGGRVQAGNHLNFKDPLVLEPRETFAFDCELLNYMVGTASFVVAMYLSGYREGM